MRLRLLFLPALFFALTLQAQTPVINWIKKNGPLGGDIRDIEVDASTGKIFLLDTDLRPFVSADNGETWQKLEVSVDFNHFVDIEITNNTIFFVGGFQLFASVDGGTSFQERMTQVSPYSDARRLKRMPTSGALVVLSSSSIYTSSNNGETWTLRNSTLPNADERYFEINAVDQIFILKPNGVFETRPFRSANSGVSFSEVSTGIPAGHHVLGLYGENNGTNVYCITSTDAFSSTNGTSWTSVKAGIADATINDYGSYNNAIIEFSADGLGMYFIDNLNHKLYSKTLAGATWVQQAIDFPSLSLSVSGAAAKDYPGETTSTAFFGTPGGVFKTTTGGASVAANNTGLASVQAEQILDVNNNDLYIRTNSLGLMKSEDGGNNWTNVPTLSSDIRYFFTDSDGYPLYAVVDYNILKRSFNRSASWDEISPLGGFLWAASPGDGQVFALEGNSSPASLFYSADNGNTWTPTAVPITGLPAQYSIGVVSGITFASASRMFVIIHDNLLIEYSYYRIDFTYDINKAITAATATKITTNPITQEDAFKATAANGKFYLFDNYSASSDRVAISADGGVSWVTRTTPGTSDFFVAENGYLFLTDGSSDKVHISRDDAVTFQETSLPSSVNVYDIRDITLDNSGYAYLAFYGDYLYQSANTIVTPSPPTGLEQIGFSATAVALRWVDDNNYERDIIIERSLNGTDFKKVGQVEGWDVCYNSGNRGFYVDTNLQPNTAYTYRLKATNAAGESAPTSTISVTTLFACAQTIPDNRSWDAVNSGVEGYTLITTPVKVGIKHLGGGKYEISDLSLGLTGSSEKSTFYESCGQTVVGKTGDLNPNGNATWDGIGTLKLKWRQCNADKTETITLSLNANDPVPEAPTGLLAYILTGTSIEVKWTASYFEKTYILERSLSASSGFAEIARIPYPETRFVDNGPLTAGTTYYYQLKSLNGNTAPGESLYAPVVSVPFKKPNFIVANTTVTDFNTSPTLGSIWADFNNDGFEDYLTMQFDAVNETAKPVIFKNLGTGDFEQITPLLDDQPYFWPSVADLDNDHFPDIALSSQETTLFDLYKGNGDFTFSKIPGGQLGDLATTIDRAISTSSSADINNDGLLDLLLTTSNNGGLKLYKQNANHSFTKIGGGDIALDFDEASLSLWADYNNDGFQDVFITNTEGAARLYANNGDETFSKTTGNGINATNFFSAAWGDYNNDGNIDLFCGVSLLNTLYKNNGDGTFTENATTAISEQNFALASSWGDYNNDGYLDLLTTGFGSTQTRLFLRDPSVTASVVFKKIISEKINDLSISHYSVAHADYDKNGLLDLALSAFIFDDANGDNLIATNNNLYQNNNPVANWVEVKLNPVNGNTESIGVKIILTAAGKTQSRELASSSSLVSKNSNIAHFGLGSASAITNIRVKWTNGSVQNYPLPPINQILVIDEDVAGPVITTKTPEHTATAVSTTTTLTMVFDENTFPVNGKKLNLTKTGETTPFISVDVTSGAKTNNQYVFTLPGNLEAETEYNITIDAAAFGDRYANAFAGVTTGTWKFTTIAVADVIAPEIDFTLPASPEKGFGTVNPSITVTDTEGVNTVVVSIRKISGSTYTDISATPGTTNTYSVALSEVSHFDATGAEFFIKATDLAGNIKRDPAGTDTYKVYLSYNANQAAIPTNRLGLGGGKTNWKVFAIPFEIASPNNAVTAIFDEFTTLALSNKTDYRLITYGTETTWSEYPSGFSALSRGEGYFINIKEDPGLIDLFNVQAPQNSRSNLFDINLIAGWNMVGNPYLTPISWDNVRDMNGLAGTVAQLKKFSGGTYSNNQNLESFEGGFVFSDVARTITIPFLNQISAGGRKRSLDPGNDISADSWEVPIKINQGEFTYNLSAIGMTPEANASMDDYDDITPPRFFNYLEINFSHPEHFSKRFTRDIVPTQKNYTWEFTVDSNLEGMAKLSWDDEPLPHSDKDLFLLDIKSQKLLNMKQTGTYSFSPKESSRFRIYFGENLKIAPEQVQLGKAYPNPTNGYTIIAFSLPETGGLNQKVTLDIVDLTGRPVSIVSQGGYNPGYHEAGFYAKDLNTGFYTYRLSVQNRNGKTTEVNKLIIK